MFIRKEGKKKSFFLLYMQKIEIYKDNIEYLKKSRE